MNARLRLIWYVLGSSANVEELGFRLDLARVVLAGMPVNRSERISDEIDQGGDDNLLMERDRPER